ncbi:MAG: AbgT family transporter, partial [Moraxellaceae bacterium]|nr:AbgT family transporter [Moraxellaceae bacterium]
MSSRLLSLLDRIERAGNRLPAPAWLFVWLCGLVLLASWLAAMAGWQASYPDGSRTVAAVNLLSAAGLAKILTDTVSNFTGFAPVGPVIVAMLGLGLAERSGLLGAALSAVVRRTGRASLPWLVA